MENNEELIELVNGYRDLVGQCIDRVDELESMIMDGILNPVKQEIERADLKARKDAFVNEIGDKLSVFDKKLRVIEQKPDLSLNDIAFDEYEKLEAPEDDPDWQKPTASEFADAFAKDTQAKIDNFMAELANADSKEEVAEVAEEAKAAIDEAAEEQADKVEADPEAEVEVKVESEEEKPEEEKSEEVVVEDSEELSDEDKEELERMRENVRKALGVYGK